MLKYYKETKQTSVAAERAKITGADDHMWHWQVATVIFYTWRGGDTLLHVFWWSTATWQYSNGGFCTSVNLGVDFP